MHRLTLREVQEVARLAADNRMPVHGGGPTVHKVADALGLPPSEVELLLDQARQGRSPIRDFKIVAGVAALIVAFFLGFGATNLFGKREAPVVAASPSPSSVTPGENAFQAPLSPTPVVASAAPVANSATVNPNETPAQLYAPGAPVEAKTLDGDIANGVQKARRKQMMSRLAPGGRASEATETYVAR